MHSEQILAAVEAEHEDLPKDWAVAVSFDMHALLVIIGNLQLVMRHPEYLKRPSAATTRQIIDQLISGIPYTMPATRELARLGDNANYDL